MVCGDYIWGVMLLFYLCAVSKLRCDDHHSVIIVVFLGVTTLVGLFIGRSALDMSLCVYHWWDLCVVFSESCGIMWCGYFLHPWSFVRRFTYCFFVLVGMFTEYCSKWLQCPHISSCFSVFLDLLRFLMACNIWDFIFTFSRLYNF